MDKGLEFELEIENYLKLHFKNHEVARNVKRIGFISKTMRQLDFIVTIDTPLGPTEIIFECKNTNRPLDIKAVESVLNQMIDVKVQNGYIISKNGFTQAAYNRIKNCDRSISLELINFDDLKPHESIMGGIPFKGDSGVVLHCPFGWYLEASPKWIPKLAVMLPFDPKKLDMIYVNIWNFDQQANTKEQLNSNRKSYLKSNVDKNYTFNEWEDKNILYRENAAFSSDKKIKDGVIEITAYRDMPKAILELVLITEENSKSRNLIKLIQVINSAFPLVIDNNNIRLPWPFWSRRSKLPSKHKPSKNKWKIFFSQKG